MNVSQFPPKSEVLDALQNAVLPAFICSLLVALHFRLTQGRESKAGGGWSFLLAFVFACLFRDSLPLKPEGAGAWKWLLPAVAGMIGLWTLSPAFPRLASEIPRLLAVGLLSYLILPMEYRKQPVWLWPVFVSAVYFAGFLWERAAQRSHPLLIPFAGAHVLGAVAFVMIHAGSARLTDVASIAQAACLGVACISLLGANIGSGLIPGVLAVSSGVLLNGFSDSFSEVPLSAYACVGLSPLMLIVRAFGAAKPSFFSLIISLILLSVPIAVGCALAMHHAPLKFE